MSGYCPIPMPDGSDCWRAPEPDGYANICTEHMHEVAKAWVGDRRIARVRCQKCMTLSLVRDRLARLMVCAECGDVTILENSPDWQELDLDTRNLGTREPDPTYRLTPSRPRTDVVYYIRFGDRIKIGTSSNLPKRPIHLRLSRREAKRNGGT
jgi:ribosomal protein S27E